MGCRGPDRSPAEVRKERYIDKWRSKDQRSAFKAKDTAMSALVVREPRELYFLSEVRSRGQHKFNFSHFRPPSLNASSSYRWTLGVRPCCPAFHLGSGANFRIRRGRSRGESRPMRTDFRHHRILALASPPTLIGRHARSESGSPDTRELVRAAAREPPVKTEWSRFATSVG